MSIDVLHVNNDEGRIKIYNWRKYLVIMITSTKHVFTNDKQGLARIKNFQQSYQ